MASNDNLLSPHLFKVDETSQSGTCNGDVTNFFFNSNVGVHQQKASETFPDRASWNKLNGQEQPCLFQVVYPDELNLTKPKVTSVKRGRPRKKKSGVAKGNKIMETESLEVIEPIIKARTRSGRLVKLPKYIEKDFKRIEITSEGDGIQISDFKRFEEKENSKLGLVAFPIKKRVIRSQFKCPKCLKAYMGKQKMIQHLKKYPDHGPLPEGHQRFNFDVWNYLFDITQKCQPGQRGVKFCEELSNLLHNLQLLKSALFKTVTDSKNSVQIDQVLGNAIGLAPGKYKFDENELYKDVTVLKLITNTNFFKTDLNSKDVKEHDITQSEELRTETIDLESSKNKKLKPDCDIQDVSTSFLNNTSLSNEVLQIQNISATENFIRNERDENINNVPINNTQQNSTLLTHNTFARKETESAILPPDLLTENLLLHNIPTSRNSVDDLIMSGVDTGSNLLDNSTSSDEVMNVDQFVNERFKKIIEPDIELGNSTLNLDLPSLDLFNFHTT